MSLYKERAKTVEAFRWTGGPDQTEDPEWIVEAIKAGKITFEMGKLILKVDYITLAISPGGWVSINKDGLIELWTDHAFNAKYELVGDSK